jgi:hypothetical protein
MGLHESQEASISANSSNDRRCRSHSCFDSLNCAVIRPSSLKPIEISFKTTLSASAGNASLESCSAQVTAAANERTSRMRGRYHESKADHSSGASTRQFKAVARITARQVSMDSTKVVPSANENACEASINSSITLVRWFVRLRSSARGTSATGMPSNPRIAKSCSLSSAFSCFFALFICWADRALASRFSNIFSAAEWSIPRDCAVAAH